MAKSTSAAWRCACSAARRACFSAFWRSFSAFSARLRRCLSESGVPSGLLVSALHGSPRYILALLAIRTRRHGYRHRLRLRRSGARGYRFLLLLTRHDDSQDRCSRPICAPAHWPSRRSALHALSQRVYQNYNARDHFSIRGALKTVVGSPPTCLSTVIAGSGLGVYRGTVASVAAR